MKVNDWNNVEIKVVIENPFWSESVYSITLGILASRSMKQSYGSMTTMMSPEEKKNKQKYNNKKSAL